MIIYQIFVKPEIPIIDLKILSRDLGKVCECYHKKYPDNIVFTFPKIDNDDTYNKIKNYIREYQPKQSPYVKFMQL